MKNGRKNEEQQWKKQTKIKNNVSVAEEDVKTTNIQR